MGLDIKYRGIKITNQQLDFIKQLIKDNPNLSRRALSKKLCRAWNWVQQNGCLRDMVCRGYMLELHRAGYITLPEKKRNPPNPFVNRKKPQLIDIDKTVVSGKLQTHIPIEIKQVKYTEKEKLFNSLIQYYHYLGYCHPVGENLKYIILKNERPVACFAFSSAVRHLKPRDSFIGWNREKRKQNIGYLAYNTRFLILPWVNVKLLASHLLSMISKRISSDWEIVYNHPVYLLETFVDTSLFKGTCYKAANWIYVGNTTGRGKNAKTHKPTKTIKAIYVYPLCKDFRERLQDD
jgi:hypothetical protein